MENKIINLEDARLQKVNVEITNLRSVEKEYLEGVTIKDEALLAEDKLIAALLDKVRFDRNKVLRVTYDSIQLVTFTKEINDPANEVDKILIYWLDQTKATERNEQQKKELEQIAFGENK